MSREIWQDAVVKAIDASFVSGEFIYLETEQQVLDELGTLTAAQASLPLPGAGNSVANQVKHLITSTTMYATLFAGEGFPDLDWGADWSPATLSDDDWTDLQAAYGATRDHLKTALTTSTLPDEGYAATAISLVAHLAYHIGQIRHAIGYATQAEGASA